MFIVIHRLSIIIIFQSLHTNKYKIGSLNKNIQHGLLEVNSFSHQSYVFSYSLTLKLGTILKIIIAIYTRDVYDSLITLNVCLYPRRPVKL